MARLELNKLTKRYGEFYAARDVSLDVEQGEFLVLLGPSGCGKTTTLRMIAGFVEPTAGSVKIGGRDVTMLPPWKRNTGLVFQNYALFPHLTVGQNVAFGLEMRKVGKAEIDEKVVEALKLVRLDHLIDRLPRQLSGGQQQRVALARALAFRPDVLLLDEPLSNLDAKLRNEVRVEIRSLQQRLGITAVMVTHDQEEALTMADRLVVMRDGGIRQIGSQQDLYERPADHFVADFVGRSSFLSGTMTGEDLKTPGGLTIRCAKSISGPAVVALRPERVFVGSEPIGGTDNAFQGEVEFVSYLGGMIDIHVRLSPDDHVIAQVPNHDTALPEVGDTVHVGWAATSAVFPADADLRE
ncbi:Fe3+/spermidine/putrescine ABC transporter ATP-binding protein [Acuticoccus sediminis]|uniref:Fe3+/spermidine/putrescine ABC transporter ATP-binding protein n=1 Tax=Acuticoccus sediminis TaxID=2184697 RepID=A0A8B2NZS7_9HYPH|nr:ABC transporter ATP-binding protein [Acuticoccus sediminis]RAI03204.1 Fe3+/spermidine/putrescine ABC transporter ATP-binding protein [Acuticoccus sediminis]